MSSTCPHCSGQQIRAHTHTGIVSCRKTYYPKATSYLRHRQARAHATQLSRYRTHAGILISLQQIGNSCRNTSSCAAHVCTGASYGASKTSSTEQQCNTQKQAHVQVDSTTHVTFLHSAAGVPPPLHTESIQALSARTLCGLPAHTWYTNIIQSGLSLECVHVQHHPHYGAKTANPVPIPLDQSGLTS